MINRVLIRTRVLQTAYAHLHRGELKLTAAEQDLMVGLERTYDLYLYLLQLIPSLTDFYQEVLDVRRRKHLATCEERSPNLRLIRNRFALQLASSEKLQNWYNQFGLRWQDDETLLRHLIRLIEDSSLYDDYLKGSTESYEQDQNFWADAFHHLFAADELLNERLEQQSIFWENDLKVQEKIECEERPSGEEEQVQAVIEEAKSMGQYQSTSFANGPVEVVKDFVEKTLRKAVESQPIDEQILPMFREEDDETFARHLLRQALVKHDEYLKLIEPILTEGWSSERLADMDALLLRLGVTEFLHFPGIPTHITINEYVELAKHFSTAHSASFINGILDAMAKRLREEGKILKQ